MRTDDMRTLVYTFFLLILLPSCGDRTSNKQALASNYIKQSVMESENGNYKKALHQVNRAIETEKKPHYLAMKATLLFQIDDIDGSIALFQDLIHKKDTPSTIKAEAKNNLACVYMSIGKKNEAQKLWNDLLHDPDYLTPEVLYLNLALIQINNQQYKAAEKLLNKALDHTPEYIDALYYLAVVQKMMHEYKRALKTIETLTNYVHGHIGAQRLKQQIEQLQQ
jgi:Tfp pilus assembly protein PilF